MDTLYGHQNAISMIDISKDGKLLASSSYDGSMYYLYNYSKIWDLIGGNCLTTIVDDHDFIPKYI